MLRADLSADIRCPQAPQRRGAGRHAGARARERSKVWLAVLNDHILGQDNNYLCGNTITIADYHASSYVALAELTGTDYSAYPNVKQWLDRMKALKSWKSVYQVVDGFAASFKGKPMVAV